MLLGLRNRREVAAFLADFLTPREVRDISRRWAIVKLLAKGVPHRVISSRLKVSIAKVTRGSHALRRSKGAFTRFLKRQ